jgi:hypothetical protein
LDTAESKLGGPLTQQGKGKTIEVNLQLFVVTTESKLFVIDIIDTNAKVLLRKTNVKNVPLSFKGIIMPIPSLPRSSRVLV